jgi:hypothetical protein
MSAPYEFSISRARMIQLVLCLVVIQVLLYGAGVATGLLVSPKVGTTLTAQTPKASAQAEEKQAVTVAEAALKPGAPAASEPTSTPAAAPAAAPVSAPASEPASKAATSGGPAASGSGSTGSGSAGSAATGSGSEPVPAGGGVAVQVASFHTKSSAVRLADILKKQGYGPVLVGESDVDGTQVWHFVQLGPYKEWDEASRIVAELDRSYAVHAYVRPIRNSSN